MTDEARKHIREPMDQYASGPQTSDRWYAAVEEMERRAAAALVAAEERGWEECNEAWKKDAATEGIVLSHADGEPWFRAKDGHILDDRGNVLPYKIGIRYADGSGYEMVVGTAAESAARGEGKV